MRTIMTGDKPNRVAWRRGFHRIFLVLCVLWAGYVLIGIPIRQSQQASTFAATVYSFNADHPAVSDDERATRTVEQNQLWEQASLMNVYKDQIVPNLHWFLLAVVGVPAVVYALARAVWSLASWLYRGFVSPKQQ